MDSFDIQSRDLEVTAKPGLLTRTKFYDGHLLTHFGDEAMNSLNVTHSKRRIPGLFSLGALTLGISLGASSQVWAGAGVFDFTDTCTGINCASQSINGTFVFDQFGQALPFTTQVYAEVASCLRLDVTSQQSDLELVLVSPNGTVWRDDDTNGNRPLIKVNGASARGWFTVQVSSYNGLGQPAGFVLRYGRYNVGNPNCTNPTPAM